MTFIGLTSVGAGSLSITPGIFLDFGISAFPVYLDCAAIQSEILFGASMKVARDSVQWVLIRSRRLVSVLMQRLWKRDTV
jgi:hypothetical protein